MNYSFARECRPPPLAVPTSRLAAFDADIFFSLRLDAGVPRPAQQRRRSVRRALRSQLVSGWEER